MSPRRKKKKYAKRTRLLLGLNLMVCIALLISYLAPYSDPQKYWPIAFFGIGYPLLLIVNILCVVFWLIKKSIYLFVSLVAILIGYKPLKKHVGFHSGPSQETISNRDSTDLRVLTYNVHLFRENDHDTQPKTKEEVTNLIKSVTPDVVCIQEFYTRKKGIHNIRQSITGALNLPYSYFHAVVENEYEAYGLLIASRYPIQNSGSIPSYTGKKTLNRVIYADIVRHGRAFRVYNVHLQSIGFQPQDYAFVKDVKKHAFEKDNVTSTKRIGGRLKRAFIERSEQAKHLRQEIDRCRKPVIITGDFNDTPLSYAVNTIGSELNNSFVEKGSGLGRTYNGDFPNFQIDYILSSRSFKVKEYQILKKKLSDHYAVWSDLHL
ncbi:endonuclease/exonuclease/phosphatase family protein [Olivibacter sp. SDN3]|uniref:endonuclease/exonuclease/phosphatase family protein n=1 Tax=Olivibacter sp. SDN3 TaxID=2764720 RepID=UPI0016517B2C|nr:endonuclease/exonuclease/phosphatase family protein [Olivibacter sp. SDN3]QNL51276.1 endonuclease/exonuclease/phosphatase family protein [Olivibacter sp. SDN3]